MSPVSPTFGAAGTAKVAAGSDAELRKVAQQFEAIFARQVIGAMRSARLGDDMLGQGGEMFREQADARMADGLAEKGALGIADMLVKQFGARDRTGR